MFHPNATHRQNRPWQGGRGAGALRGFDEVRNPPAVVVTGRMGAPSWPSGAPPEQRKALPRADTKRQGKADRRLTEKGGQAWLDGQPGRRRRAT